MVYSNFDPVNPTIITGNNNRQFPVMNSDAAEEPGSHERASQSVTATTDVAGAEQTTRTGRRYNQISSSRVETKVSEFEATSRKCCSHSGQTVAPGTTAKAHTCEGGGVPLEGWVTTEYEVRDLGLSEESSVRQTSFTKLSAEVEVEMGEEAEVELERGNGFADCCTRKADFSETFEDSDGESRVKCCEEMAEGLLDARTGHPTSMLGVQSDGRNVQPTRLSRAKHAVPESVAELYSEGPDEDYRVSDVDITVLYSNINTAVSESGSVSNEVLDTGEWSSERQRPTRATRRLTRLGYREFETQFQSEERRRCNKLGSRDQAGSNSSNVGSFNKHVRKANVRFRLGRGVKQKTVRETYLLTGSRPTSPNQQKETTRELSLRADKHVEKQPIKRKRKSLSKTGNGIQGAATKLQHSPANTKDFRKPSQESSEDKTRRSLNTGSLTGAQNSCGSPMSERTEMKEGSEKIQDCETYKGRRRDNAKTTTSTGSATLLNITSATPARHGEPSKNRR